MKFLRLKISSEILKLVNFEYLLEYYEEIELLEFFHYDKKNFFSLERMIIKPKYEENWREIIEKTHKITYFDLLSKNGNEITALMNISKKTGFYPLIGNQAWAIIPPTQIDQKSILINLLAPAEILPKLYEIVGKYGESFDILAINDFKKSFNEQENILFPKFTQRQKEVAKFAVRNGYYDSPKNITAHEIAEKFEISISAVNEHLRKVRKIALEYFFS